MKYFHKPRNARHSYADAENAEEFNICTESIFEMRERTDDDDDSDGRAPNSEFESTFITIDACFCKCYSTEMLFILRKKKLFANIDRAELAELISLLMNLLLLFVTAFVSGHIV